MALNDTLVIFTGEIYSSDTNSYLLGLVIQTRDLQRRRPKKWNINFFSSLHDFFCASDPVFIQDRRVGITGGGANRRVRRTGGVRARHFAPERVLKVTVTWNKTAMG